MDNNDDKEKERKEQEDTIDIEEMNSRRIGNASKSEGAPDAVNRLDVRAESSTTTEPVAQSDKLDELTKREEALTKRIKEAESEIRVAKRELEELQVKKGQALMEQEGLRIVKPEKK